MADADVPITAGTGTKIDTRTVGAGTDEHRQVVVIGDPATAANVASADAANGLDVDVTRLPALPAGTNNIGDVDVVSVPAITKGTQGSTGLSVQDLKDAGRTNWAMHMVAQVAATTTDTLMSLTGWKGNAAVAATTTPAVVTAGKILRLATVQLTAIATATAGTVMVTLRANTGGVVAITSPVVARWQVGSPAAVAGVSDTVVIPLPDGFEFPAGTGLGISIQGFGPTGTASGNNWFQMSMHGFEY